MAGAGANGHYPPQNAAMPPQTTPETVGNQFVNQFYTVMKSSPRYLHRFYTDESTFTHVDPGHTHQAIEYPPVVFTVNNQKNIHERVMALGFDDANVDLFTMDSQYSLGQGVIVQVTGALQYKGKIKRNFVQTFFLAVQERGYFVLNDLFRYLADAKSSGPPQQGENGFPAGHLPAERPTAPPAPNGTAYPVAATVASSAPHPPPQTQPPHIPHHHPSVPPPIPARVAPPTPAQLDVDVAGVQQQAPHSVVHAHEHVTTGVQHPPAPPPPPAEPSYSQPQVHEPAQQAPPAPRPTPIPSQPQPRAGSAPTARPPAAADKPSAPPAGAGGGPSAPQPPPANVLVPQKPSPAPSPPQEIAADAAAPPAKAAETSKPEEEEVPTQEQDGVLESLPPAEAESTPSAPSAPLTYAERLKKGAQKAAPPAPKPAPAAPAGPASPPTPPAPSSSRSRPQSPSKAQGTQPGTEVANGINPTGFFQDDVPCTSIFVREFPQDVTPEKLEEAFSRFGKVKGGARGVSLKNQRGKDGYAFVEFEEAAAVQAAMDGQVFIGGQQVMVTEKRPMMFGRGGGRGGGFPRGGRGDRGGFVRGGRDGGRGGPRGGRGYGNLPGDAPQFGRGRGGGRNGDLGGRGGEGRGARGDGGRRGGRDAS